MSQALEEYEDELDKAGFLTREPPPGQFPDLPLLAIYENEAEPHVDTQFVLLCANQCARDQGHNCGVAVPLSELILVDGGWVPTVGSYVPWMVLSWGPHLHQLPFCCAACLIEFVERRTLSFELQRSRAN